MYISASFWTFRSYFDPHLFKGFLKNYSVTFFSVWPKSIELRCFSMHFSRPSYEWMLSLLSANSGLSPAHALFVPEMIMWENNNMRSSVGDSPLTNVILFDALFECGGAHGRSCWAMTTLWRCCDWTASLLQWKPISTFLSRQISSLPRNSALEKSDQHQKSLMTEHIFTPLFSFSNTIEWRKLIIMSGRELHPC